MRRACAAAAAAPRRLTLAVLLALAAAPGAGAQVAPDDPAAVRLDSGRFTVVAYPSDLTLARALLDEALRRDTFPGLPRPQARVLLAVAPDQRRFREWIGPHAPEWGAAVAFPGLQRIVMRGQWDGGRGGPPATVLRHELAHLALHEAIGDLPPRWFDEGYASFAAGEWGRDELLATNAALVFRRMPALDTLDGWFLRGEREAQGAYALSYRAVAELAALDPERGLTLFFGYWRESGRLDAAVRRAYGLTLPAFEERWQQRTRRRFAVLALVGDFAVGMLLCLVLVLPFYMLRRRRDRERMAALRAADAAQAAAAERILAELLGHSGDEGGPPGSTVPSGAEPRAPGPAGGWPAGGPGEPRGLR